MKHATAVIHEATRIPDSVTVGAYAVIEDGVEIGEGTIIQAHAMIRSGTVLGENCFVDSHTVLGGLPQDLQFNPKTPSGVHIGNRVVLREGVTVNRASQEGAFTEIRDDCFLMANSHLGHDCKIGEHVVLANGVLLGGHVHVNPYTFMGGGAAVHQFCRIGESVMIGGLARISQDIPPFCMAAERNGLIGINLIGLQRRGFSREDIRELKKLFSLIFDVEGSPKRLAEGIRADGLGETPSARQLIEFLCADSRKGVARRRLKEAVES